MAAVFMHHLSLPALVVHALGVREGGVLLACRPRWPFSRASLSRHPLVVESKALISLSAAKNENAAGGWFSFRFCRLISCSFCASGRPVGLIRLTVVSHQLGVNACSARVLAGPDKTRSPHQTRMQRERLSTYERSVMVIRRASCIDKNGNGRNKHSASLASHL